MSQSTSSGNLSKGDAISFIALLLMGVLLFFGINFKTMGDRVPAIVGAVIIIVLMTVFVFFAAYAKMQNRYQSTWKKVEYAMVSLYILALIPCYVLSAVFFDVQFNKENIIKQVQADTDDLNKLFTDYNRKCESRATAYQINLESMLTSREGRERIAGLLNIGNSSEVNGESVAMAVSSFTKRLRGSEYSTLEQEKNNLVNNCKTNFNNWNIMFIPQYASELDGAKSKFAGSLERIYTKARNDIETRVPELDIRSYACESRIVDTFKSTDDFSITAFLAVLFLGFLGLVKYLFGSNPDVMPMKAGTSNAIIETGGFTFK